jgi:hypothetical protein
VELCLLCWELKSLQQHLQLLIIWLSQVLALVVLVLDLVGAVLAVC